MSKAIISWICLILVVFVPVIEGRIARLGDGANGGVDCAVCSIVLGLVDKISIVYNTSIVNSLERLCSFLPSEYKVCCKVAVDFLGKFKSCEIKVEML